MFDNIGPNAWLLTAGTLTVGTGAITATLGTDQAFYFCDSSDSGSTCAYVTSLYTSVSIGTYTSGSSAFTPMSFAAALLPAGTYTVAIVETPPPPASEFNVACETNVVISGGGGTSSGADDCSSVTNPDAKLLGWSTSANFPVELAQSQIDKGWGAIDDTFDGVRMIFIPAGQATFISGPNSLHPIWAS